MRDNFGRTYARLNHLKPDDQIIVDDGFEEIECRLTKFSRHTIYAERRTWRNWRTWFKKSELYIICAEGHHSLEGQLGDDAHDDSLIGIYPAETFIFREGER